MLNNERFLECENKIMNHFYTIEAVLKISLLNSAFAQRLLNETIELGKGEEDPNAYLLNLTEQLKDEVSSLLREMRKNAKG